MTARLDIDRVLDDFLAEGTGELSDRVLAAALTDIKHTPQRRALRVPRRYSDMPTPLRLLVAAALIATAMGGAFLLGGSFNREPAPEPSLSPTPPAPAGDAQRIGSAPGGRYTASRPVAFGLPAGDYALELRDGEPLIVSGPANREILLGSVTNTAEGRAELGSTDRCAESGTYDYALSEDGRTFSIETVEDSCTDRAAILHGDWQRDTINHELVPGQSYAVDIGAGKHMQFTIPFGFRHANGNPPSVWLNLSNSGEIVFDAEDFFVLVEAGPSVQRDRCDTTRGEIAIATTLDEFVTWNTSARGVVASDPVPTTVGGHDAVYLDLATTDACPNGTPEPDCFCMPATSLWAGFDEPGERIWGVDVDGRIVVILFHDDNAPLLALTPERQAIANELVASMLFE
jgi:hypothetical protein